MISPSFERCSISIGTFHSSLIQSWDGKEWKGPLKRYYAHAPFVRSPPFAQPRFKLKEAAKQILDAPKHNNG
jgi:hypothetical protein